jgi:hypothetical protein
MIYWLTDNLPAEGSLANDLPVNSLPVNDLLADNLPVKSSTYGRSTG